METFMLIPALQKRMVFDSSSSSSEPKSPLLVILLIHKAICNELHMLNQWAMAYDAVGQPTADCIRAFIDRCIFLRSVYDNYSNAKDEILITAILDANVTNIAETYFLQYQTEKSLFDHLFKLVTNSGIETKESFPSKELIYITAALHKMVGQYMAKEEEQVFPLLIQKLSLEQQAFLIWRLMCSIPTDVLAKLIHWLTSYVSHDHCLDLYNCLSTIVPEDKLLRQVFFTWMERKYDCAGRGACQKDVTNSAHDQVNGTHPIDDIQLWHNAIERELNVTLAEAKGMRVAGAFTNSDLLALCDRVQFIAQICIFHSIAEEKVIYPAVQRKVPIFQKQKNEESITNEFRCLIESVKNAGTVSAADEFHSKIGFHADRIMETLKVHFRDEKFTVLPLIRKHLSFKTQQELLHQILCVMPLKLIERVLPWLLNSLTTNEADHFVKNMQLFAASSDSALVQLFCSWASSGSNHCLGPSSSLHINNLAPSHLVQETYNSLSVAGIAGQPVDVVFIVHKAIHRDLEHLDNECQRLSNCDEVFLQKFIEKFCLLWVLYRAHTNAVDNIVYPALESREALQNVSHSYTFDRKNEQQAFEKISGVLLELSHLDRSRRTCAPIIDVGRYNQLATSLPIMFKSLRMMATQHMYREELELRPLFGIHFSVEEQNKMIGFILGTTGADILQSMLPWLISALTEDEQIKMMDTFKQVTKNTMFNDWLSECWKETSLSNLQPKLETRITLTDSTFPVSRWQMDHAFNSHWKGNLKQQMSSYWIAAQRSLPVATEMNSSDNEELKGRSPTFRDPEKTVYGCKHYKRNCKLHAACCGKLFTCRFCHDSTSDHAMDRKETSEMMCMRCLIIQPVGKVCATPSCNGYPMAKYYCSTCKLFDDERNVYHCPFCNICRVGKGLGIDYFHCMSCNCCMAMSLVKHKCQEKCLETNCPICNEYLFTSSSAIKASPCGHFMHSACLKASTQCQSHHACPVCNKSSGDTMMESAKSSLVVDDDQLTEMKSSWSDAKLQGRFYCTRASFGVNMLLCQFVLWFEHHHERIVVPGFLRRLQRSVEKGVAGQKAKERCLLCFALLCILVLFCIISAVLILAWFKALGTNNYF